MRSLILRIVRRFRPATRRNGFATVTTALLLGLILSFGTALVSYMMTSRQAGKVMTGTFSATQVADAGVQKALFCLKALTGTNCGGTYGTSYVGESGVDVGYGTFSTTVTGSGTLRSVTSVGTALDGRTVTVKVDITTEPPVDENLDFNYALQSGDLGAHLENNASISGTLYAGGDVDCQTTNAGVTGDMYISKSGGKIDTCEVEYDAHADRILNSDVHGDAYYRTDPADIAGTTVDGAKYPGSPTPAQQPLPSMDIQFWRDSAEYGGTIYGDHYPADGASLGPIKIMGDLVLGQNVDVTITGPVWVVGDVVTDNNSSLSLSPGWGANSTVILADDPGNEATSGRITIVNNTAIYGSGDPKSHILLATTNSSTSDTTPALSVANNAAGAVFFAGSGTMRLQNGAGAKSLAAKRLFIDQNATVTYTESELADMEFSNSPPGTWRLKQDTWRIVK